MLSRSIVLQSLRSIRDRFFDTGPQRNEQNDVGAETSHDVTGPSLDNLSVAAAGGSAGLLGLSLKSDQNTAKTKLGDHLKTRSPAYAGFFSRAGDLEVKKVDMQFHIMTFLSPQDLCRLGGTSTYWRSMVRDPVLWKYFLLRDMPLWKSVDNLSMPEIKLSGTSMLGDPEMNHFDYMAEYLRVCPACRNQWRQQPRATFESVTSFFQSFVPGTAEPKFVMFGPGLEQLEVSLMTRIMNSPHVLPIAGIPQSQIEGIGSGISFKFKDQHSFNIITVYSTYRTERERARLEHLNLRSKVFLYQEDSDSNAPLSLNPMFNKAFQAVNGFIFVANAEMERGSDQSWEEESAQIRVMLDPAVGSVSRPILVLSCISRETADTHRIPCVTVADHLQLSSLSNPWMVQDTAAESLTGLLDGIDWLMRNSDVRL